MTAFIEGSVQTPTGRIVPMTVHAKPIPDPGKLAEGQHVLVAGNLAAGVRTPISASLHPGRYRLRVYTPAGLAEGQHVTIAELLEPTTVAPVEPEPRAQPGVTPPAPAGPSDPLPEGWDVL